MSTFCSSRIVRRVLALVATVATLVVATATSAAAQGGTNGGGSSASPGGQAVVVVMVIGLIVLFVSLVVSEYSKQGRESEYDRVRREEDEAERFRNDFDDYEPVDESDPYYW